MRQQKPWFIKVWDDGKYVDLWTVNHVLAGVILAGIFTLWGLNPWIGLAFAVILMVAWEVIEIWSGAPGLIESKENSFLDVLTGLVGYGAMYVVIINIDSSQSLPILFGATAIWVVLETWGFLSLRYDG